MSKYRIVKKAKHVFGIEQRFMFIWMSLVGLYDVPIYFKTKKKAKKYIKQVTKREIKQGWFRSLFK